MADTLDVTRYLVELSHRGPEPEGVTPLRLQKLLYYAQGWHVAAFDRPLYSDPIIAGPAGPVVRAVEDAIRQATGGESGRGVRPGDLGPCGLSFRDRRFVEAIWFKYQNYSAAGLRDLILGESPWVDARSGGREDSASEPVITTDSLRRSFGARPELHHFDPREWEKIGEGEADIAAGKVLPLSEAMKRLRGRCVTN